MKMSFVKTIEGHEIEFIRLLYPLRYDIVSRVENANPCRLTVEQNADGTWQIREDSHLPPFLGEISLEIQNAIEDNEAEGAGNSTVSHKSIQ